MKSLSCDIDDKKCNVLVGSIGNSVVDLSPVLKSKDMFAFDPGFVSTASCVSNITYIDGDEGILMHRGYNIEGIVAHKTYMEAMYLLLHDDFPSNAELRDFKTSLLNTKVDVDFLLGVANSLPDSTHPMAVILTLISALAGLRAPIRKTEDPYLKCLDLIKHTLFIVAMAGCKAISKPFNPDFFEEDYTTAFAKMFLSPEIYTNPNALECLDKILTLHIDHEQNASTSTLRMVASTKCDLYGAAAAATAALWGPLHGGANEAVLNMLSEIDSVENIPSFLEKVKSKEGGAKLMGFGHRVYKNYDPRAKALKSYSDKFIETSKNTASSKSLEIAKILEKTAVSDEYFVSRKLFPNVDFYSGIIYSAMGIPTSMFTCMFALSRISGWCAQWLEASKEDGKIWRPRQLYVGDIDKKIA